MYSRLMRELDFAVGKMQPSARADLALAAVGLVPRRDRLDLRVGAQEELDRLRVLRDARDVALAPAGVRVLEGDQKILAAGVVDPLRQRGAVRAAGGQLHHVVG